MCSVKSPTPTNAPPSYVHNPYLDGGAYGNSVDANRIGTSALTIGLDPKGTGAVGPGLTITPPVYNPGGSLNTPDTPGSSSGGSGNGAGNTGGGGASPGNPGGGGIRPALN